MSATTLTSPGAAAAYSAAGRAVRLGAVSYLNAEPAVHGLEADPGFRLERDVPSRVARRLHAAEVDLGIIPSIEYCFGHYAIVPGCAIASRGPVRSVCLFHHGPLEKIRRVALDTSSRTSVALAKVLLRERLGRSPQYVPMAPSLVDMLAVADAALLIGDPALDAEGIDELREIIVGTGALQHVETLIDTLTDQCFRALDSAPVDDEAREVLRGLAVAATSRSV